MTVGGGMVAAGHPADRGGRARSVLREGGNAVDAAVAAVLASWVCEPLLTGPGAGGYMLVAGGGRARVLLDFFVEAPGARRATRATTRALLPVDVSFGDARPGLQLSAPRRAASRAARRACDAAARRWGSVAAGRPRRAGGARSRARASRSTPQQAYIFEILDGILRSTPRGAGRVRARRAPAARGRAVPQRRARRRRSSGSAPTGAAPFYTRRHRRGDRRARRRAAAGMLGAADLAAYAPIDREPVRAAYRGREILTNPPPSAGGVLLALAFARLGARHGRAADRRGPRRGDGGRAGAAHDASSPTGLRGARASSSASCAANLGSTTHISVLDADGPRVRGHVHERRGLRRRRPGHRHPPEQHHGRGGPQPATASSARPPGRRMPSMMAPTVVLGADGDVELVLGQRGLQPDPLGDPAGRRERRRPRHGRGRRDRRAAPARRGRRCSTPSRASTSRALEARAAATSCTFRAPQPLLRRRAGGRARPVDGRAQRRRRPAPRRQRGGGVRARRSRRRSLRGGAARRLRRRRRPTSSSSSGPARCRARA